jgi:translation initiation factor 3 subunit F
MASPLAVKVHPLVLLTMVDSFERRSKKGTTKDQALGTLMGFYEKNVIQVTDCYAIPFRVTQGGMPEVDDSFNREMYHAARRTTPSEQMVGWFFTVSDLSNHCEQFHNYFSQVVSSFSVRREQPPIILLTLDVNFAECGKGNLPIRAFLRSEGGIQKQNHARIFQPLSVEIEGFQGENVALDLIMKGVNSSTRETVLDVGLNPIAEGVDQMIEWLERILKYVDEVLAKNELPEDSTIGRRLNEIVDTAATLLQADKRDNLIKNSLRDYTMISYLANLTNAQLALEEPIIKH